MANQRRSEEYLVPISSYQIKSFRQGILKPGIYHGFDGATFNNSDLSAPTVTITHPTGIGLIDDNNQLEQDVYGVAVTPIGTLIQVPNNIELTLASVAGFNSTQFRFDTVVLSYNYVKANGGQPASYSVVTGQVLSIGPNGPGINLPTTAVLNPQTDIIIGYVRVNHTGITDFIPIEKSPISLLDNQLLNNKPFIKQGGYSETVEPSIEIGASDSIVFSPHIIITESRSIDILPIIHEGPLRKILPLGTKIKVSTKSGVEVIMSLTSNPPNITGQAGLRDISNNTSGTLMNIPNIRLAQNSYFEFKLIEVGSNYFWDLIDSGVNPMRNYLSKVGFFMDGEVALKSLVRSSNLELNSMVFSTIPVNNLSEGRRGGAANKAILKIVNIDTPSGAISPAAAPFGTPTKEFKINLRISREITSYSINFAPNGFRFGIQGFSSDFQITHLPEEHPLYFERPLTIAMRRGTGWQVVPGILKGVSGTSDFVFIMNTAMIHPMGNDAGDWSSQDAASYPTMGTLNSTALYPQTPSLLIPQEIEFTFEGTIYSA